MSEQESGLRSRLNALYQSIDVLLEAAFAEDSQEQVEQQPSNSGTERAPVERRRRRRCWTEPYLERRQENSLHRAFFFELAVEDPFRFRRCLRMNEAMFVELLRRVSPLISKNDTHLRQAIPADERLSTALRYLATGETQESLRTNFRIGQSTISGILREVIPAIVQVLQPDYLTVPRNAEQWKAVARQYQNLWQFPHVLGAVDGKHVRIVKPIASGSSFNNFKGFMSVVLLAAVDADLRFIYVDVGSNGRVSDTGIWNNCDLNKALVDRTLDLPPPEPLFEGGSNVPYFFIADEGLPLSSYMLTPYPLKNLSNNPQRRVYNYRLSRARMNVECAFGVLSARFGIFGTTMRCDPEDAVDRVMACCCLHNWLRTEEVGRQMYTPPGFLDEELPNGDLIEGQWRTQQAIIPNLCRQGSNYHSQSSLALRETMCEYFNGVGAIPQQDRVLRA